jgi:hypothetical protein
MFTHICCKYMLQIFYMFQTYVAFKCFMLHVFRAVQRVRGHRRMGRGEPMAHGRGVRRAGSRRTGARWARVRVRCARMGAGQA